MGFSPPPPGSNKTGGFIPGVVCLQCGGKACGVSGSQATSLRDEGRCFSALFVVKDPEAAEGRGHTLSSLVQAWSYHMLLCDLGEVAELVCTKGAGTVASTPPTTTAESSVSKG